MYLLGFSIIEEDCEFSGSNERLQLDVRDKERRLELCGGEGRIGAFCSFRCDFMVDESKQNLQNIEEYNIRALQVTDYTLRKSTTFGIVRSTLDREIDRIEEEPPKDTGIAFGVVCGNGVTETENGEQCDDGNTLSGDGCDENCQIEVIVNDEEDSEDEFICGNDVLEEEIGEVCDHGGICNDGGFCIVGSTSCADESECSPYEGNGCVEGCTQIVIG